MDFKNSFTFFLLFFTYSLMGQTSIDDLQIQHLKGDFYIFTTYNEYNGSRIPSNGMYLVTDEGVALFDTPWDTTQFQPLLDSIKTRHNKPVVFCIATHFHDDKTAGLSFYKQKGVKTYTTRLTDSLSRKNGKNRAEYLIEKDSSFTLGKYTFETYYPGEGHTADNIVVWFGKEKILYGGCLIKSINDENLGYLGDANRKEYAQTIKNLINRYPNPQYVIVGHDDWANPKSLVHTLKMAESLQSAK